MTGQVKKKIDNLLRENLAMNCSPELWHNSIAAGMD